MAQKRNGNAERQVVTREMFHKDAAAVGRLARNAGGVVVTDAQGRALFLLSTPADKWPVETKKAVPR
jgi:hypothetical protein